MPVKKKATKKAVEGLVAGKGKKIKFTGMGVQETLQFCIDLERISTCLKNAKPEVFFHSWELNPNWGSYNTPAKRKKFLDDLRKRVAKVERVFAKQRDILYQLEHEGEAGDDDWY